jgi:hypothetical protein
MKFYLGFSSSRRDQSEWLLNWQNPLFIFNWTPRTTLVRGP